MSPNPWTPLKRCVLFGVDGGGTFFEQALTPHMDKIFASGAISRRTLTEIPTISAECWGAMLHGVSRTDHQLTNWLVGARPYPVDSPYPSVFRVIREACPDAKMAAFSDWWPINYGIIEDDIDVYKFSARDYALIGPAIEYINNTDFTFIFFQFDSVDGMGHRYEYGSPEHLASITTVDRYIRAIVDAVEARGWGDETLFLVEADHGGLHHSHGGVSDEEKYVTFMAAGQGIQNGEIDGMEVRDTSSVILHALGLKQPESWTGRVPGGIFPDVPTGGARPAGKPRPTSGDNRRPIEEKGAFLTTFASREPKVYLPFDENVPCMAENLEKHGKFYRVAGMAGEGMRFDDGWMAMTCPDMREGFTFATWMRLGAMVQGRNVYLLSTRPARFDRGDTAPGALIFIDGLYLKVSMSDGRGGRFEPLIPLPPDSVGKWFHIIVSLDLKARRVTAWIDFQPCFTVPIPEDVTIDLSADKLYIAQDATEKLDTHLPATLDDYALFARPMTGEDAEALKAYYGQ